MLYLITLTRFPFSVLENWDLEIHPVTLEDDDEFQCQAHGSLPGDDARVKALRSRMAVLTVMVPPENPFIVQGPLHEVIESTPVALECVAKGGKPAAKVRRIFKKLNRNFGTIKSPRILR